MAQQELTGRAPRRTYNRRIRQAPPRSRPSSIDAIWSARIGIVLVLALGGLFAYTLPAVWLDDGSSVSVQDASTAITFKNAGWVVTLGWFALALAMISAIVFPRTERLIQAMAVSAGSIAAMVIRLLCRQSPHRRRRDRDIIRHRPGARLDLLRHRGCPALAGHLCSGIVARARSGGTGRAGCSCSPRQPGCSCSRSSHSSMRLQPAVMLFLYGRINRYVGGDNYKRLFDTGSIWSNLGLSVVVAAVAGAAITGLGLLVTFANSREITRADVRRVIWD